MAEESRSLRSVFAEADAKRKDLEAAWDSNSTTYQENLSSAIVTYKECVKIASEISLFSPNETLDDISSADLQYLLIHYHVADLILKITGTNRKEHLQQSRAEYGKFLKLLDSYDILSTADLKLYELYKEAPDSFSTASTRDPAARRDAKIARFREEKSLKQKLEHLRQNPAALQNDDSVLRDLHLTNIQFGIHQTFQSLESIAQELQILAMAPPHSPSGQAQGEQDMRERNGRNQVGYSERLDSRVPLSSRTGPILSKNGKPLRPFTLLDNRQRLRDGVFRPDHNLPTMTIDEYLEEERKRGGIIEGGGKQSGMIPEPNEDDLEKADEETMKARAWDEFKEDNPKGSGNTINRG